MSDRWNKTGVNSEAPGKVIVAFTGSIGLGLGTTATVSSRSAIAVGQSWVHFSAVVIESGQIIMVAQNLEKLRLGSDALSTRGNVVNVRFAIARYSSSRSGNFFPNPSLKKVKNVMKSGFILRCEITLGKAGASVL